MLLFVISFLIGISQLMWLPTLNLTWVIPLILPVLIGLLNRKKHPIFVTIFALGLGIIYGIISGTIAKSHQLNTIPFENIQVEGIVINLPIHKKDRVKFALKVESMSAQLPLKKILVNWYKNPDVIKPGQKWLFELKLKPIHGYKNPGSFDYSKWLFRQGYDAIATVKKAKLIESQNYDLSTLINVFRAKIAKIIQQQYSVSRVQALIQALIIGDKSQISSDDSQLFKDTGTAHLVAISGLHIGLIAFVGMLFGRLLFVIIANERLNRFKLEALFAISFALIYSLLAGFSIPTIRALIMVLVFSISYVGKLKISRWYSWSIAMLVVLLIDPLSVLDLGFWFSFTAVAVLIFAFSNKMKKTNKIITFIQAQIVILIGLSLLMVLAFYQVNFLAPIVNILVLPLASFLLIPMIFVSMLVYFIYPPLANMFFFAAEKLTSLLFLFLDFVQQYNYLSISVKNISFFSICTAIIAIIILLLPKLFRWRYLALLLWLPLFLNRPNEIKNGEFKVNVLDVGQGLSVIVTTKNTVMIYDTAAKYDSGFSLASTVIIPFLQSRGIQKVDKIILSHDDNDHAGGIDLLKSEYNVTDVMGVTAEYSGCQYPLQWHWNQVKFEVYSPLELIPYLANNSSCVVKVSSEYGSILLTGDIEEPVEYRLVNKFPEQIESNVLLVPHHGSKTSSSMSFIKKVNPKIAINSSGFMNQFNHPHPKIKQQYLSEGIKFYDTQVNGMIELVFNQNGIKVSQHTSTSQHFWDVDFSNK